MQHLKGICIGPLCTALLAGCPSRPTPPRDALRLPDGNATHRLMQTRRFDIDNASLEMGTVTGSQYARHVLKTAVKVIPDGAKRMTVRANAHYDRASVVNPLPYGNFFSALSKALSLPELSEK